MTIGLESSVIVRDARAVLRGFVILTMPRKFGIEGRAMADNVNHLSHYQKKPLDTTPQLWYNNIKADIQGNG